MKKLEADFRKRVENVHKVAYEEKVKRKAEIDRKLLKNLEDCQKSHKGPITATNAHRLDKLTYEQLILEVGYMKKTIAPQLRFRRKIDGKMVNFTAEELRKQLLDIIKPKNDISNDINTLLSSALFDVSTNVNSDIAETVSEIAVPLSPPIAGTTSEIAVPPPSPIAGTTSEIAVPPPSPIAGTTSEIAVPPLPPLPRPGTHGLWQGPLDEQSFGVLLDKTTFQKYKARRFGYLPDGMPQSAEEWNLIEVIDNVCYIQKGHTIFVTFD